MTEPSTSTVLADAAAMERRGESFVLATVVWRRAPSSGRLGSKALVLPDGTMRGWLGGACASPTVRRHAAAALDDGRARLLLLGIPAEAASAFAGDDVEIVPMACGSEGELAVYIEPVVPAPLVIAVGDSPAVSTLVALARDLGWRAESVGTGDELAGYADAGSGDGERTVKADAATMVVDAATAIVIATQGHDDESSLQAALGTRAGYIGLVASRARAGLTLGYLRDRGVSDDELARVRAPAGLDLGSIEHREIAVAVLADLVARRAGGELRVRSTLPTAERHRDHYSTPPASGQAIDPICGMTVDVATARWNLEHDGRTWYFCNQHCLETFRARSVV